MYTKTWVPNTDSELDELFETLRAEQFADTSHPLYMNYSAAAFTEAVALSITFSASGKPLLVGSIQNRECWPSNIYRILTRFWKVQDVRLDIVDRTTGMFIFAELVTAQLKYAFDILKADLIFMSRESNKWQKFVANDLQKTTELIFSHDEYRYKTCDTCGDESCWQYILYYGDPTKLSLWEKK